jgi:hypothetical protein
MTADGSMRVTVDTSGYDPAAQVRRNQRILELRRELGGSRQRGPENPELFGTEPTEPRYDILEAEMQTLRDETEAAL